MKIFVSGGLGFVGRQLSHCLLDSGHQVIATGTRPDPRQIRHDGFTYVQADTARPGRWQQRLQGIDAVVNLAGKSISSRWSPALKAEIYDSRIHTTRHLVEALPDGSDIPFVSASAVGFYGDCKDQELTEEAGVGKDFLARVARDWEREAFQATGKGLRVTAARLGVVLGRGGGALKRLVPIFRMFAGGPVGSGQQWFPWIHMDDLVAGIVFLLENGEINGPVNFCAPGAIRNREFAKALGRATNRPAIFAVPPSMVRLAVGEFGDTLLGGQRIVPAKLMAAGFEYQYPRIDGALRQLMA